MINPRFATNSSRHRYVMSDKENTMINKKLQCAAKHMWQHDVRVDISCNPS